MTDSTSQTTMSNESLTSTEANEQAKDCFVHSVRKYDLKDQVYPLMGHTDYVHEFAASTTVLQHIDRSYTVDTRDKGRLNLDIISQRTKNLRKMRNKISSEVDS